jgi:hypothetical protein
MFKSRVRSYRDLPLRFADFGVLHRNEFRYRQTLAWQEPAADLLWLLTCCL